jgi:archaellum component FlaF (FlaF/FlaG flagellin family)
MDRVLILITALIGCGLLYRDNQSTNEALNHANKQIAFMGAEIDEDQRHIADLTKEVSRSHAEIAEFQARAAAPTPPPQSWIQRQLDDRRNPLER